MASKVSFTKYVNCRMPIAVHMIEYGGVDVKIGVADTLTTEQRMKLGQELLELLVNDNFFSHPKFNIYFDILFVKYIANMTFTEKQLGENIYKTYDVVKDGLLPAILEASDLTKETYIDLRADMEYVVKEMFKFKVSFLGSIMGMQDQKAANLDLAALIQEAKSPEIQALLQQFGDENGLLKDIPNNVTTNNVTTNNGDPDNIVLYKEKNENN